MEGDACRLDSVLELLQHVCLTPEVASTLDQEATGVDLGGSLSIFRSAILRVITHLTSGVAGYHVAFSIASVSTTRHALQLDRSIRRTGTNLCLSSLLMLLSYQTKLIKETAIERNQQSNDPSSPLDFFSYGLCLESLRNLMTMEAIPYSEMISLVKNIVLTFQHCDDMRVLCAAANLLSTMLSVLTNTTESDVSGSESETHQGYVEGNQSRRALCTYSSDERMHVVHYICINVANDQHIISALTHIFQFFMSNKSSSLLSKSTLKDFATEVDEDNLVPSASACDPSMWLLGNEFGMRTAGEFNVHWVDCVRYIA